MSELLEIVPEKRPAVMAGSALSMLAQQQIEDAKRGLESYINETIEAHEEGDAEEETAVAPSLAAQIAVTNDMQKRTMALRCTFSGVMTPELYQQIEGELKQALESHPAWGRLRDRTTVSCEQSPDGKVTLTADIVGLQAQDYAQLIYALAERHEAHETRKAHTGVGTEDDHQLHEKMRSAEKTLKTMIERETKDQPQPNLSVKVKKHKSKKHHNKFVLDLRLHGAMGRRASDAFEAAFHKRRSNNITGLNPDDQALVTVNKNQETPHIAVDNLSRRELGELVDALARPVMTVNGGADSELQGKVQAAPLLSILGQGSQN